MRCLLLIALAIFATSCASSRALEAPDRFERWLETNGDSLPCMPALISTLEAQANPEGTVAYIHELRDYRTIERLTEALLDPQRRYRLNPYVLVVFHDPRTGTNHYGTLTTVVFTIQLKDKCPTKWTVKRTHTGPVGSPLF